MVVKTKPREVFDVGINTSHDDDDEVNTYFENVPYNIITDDACDDANDNHAWARVNEEGTIHDTPLISEDELPEDNFIDDEELSDDLKMAKRKTNLCTHVKSVTLDGTSTQDVDQALDQAIMFLCKIESKKNNDGHSKQDDLHSASSCCFAVHAAKKAKADGRPVERAALYPIVYTQKNGSAINPTVQAKMDKMKELLANPSNQLQSSDTPGSIAWSPDDVYAKVIGKERKSRIHGVGFGPSPSA
nr:hypothetical protein CFP56_70178 [Quercus suber]